MISHGLRVRLNVPKTRSKVSSAKIRTNCKGSSTAAQSVARPSAGSGSSPVLVSVKFSRWHTLTSSSTSGETTRTLKVTHVIRPNSAPIALRTPNVESVTPSLASAAPSAARSDGWMDDSISAGCDEHEPEYALAQEQAAAIYADEIAEDQQFRLFCWWLEDRFALESHVKAQLGPDQGHIDQFYLAHHEEDSQWSSVGNDPSKDAPWIRKFKDSHKEVMQNWSKWVSSEWAEKASNGADGYDEHQTCARVAYKSALYNQKPEDEQPEAN